jgi:hypothetical protein
LVFEIPGLGFCPLHLASKLSFFFFEVWYFFLLLFSHIVDLRQLSSWYSKFLLSASEYSNQLETCLKEIDNSENRWRSDISFSFCSRILSILDRSLVGAFRSQEEEFGIPTRDLSKIDSIREQNKEMSDLKDEQRELAGEVERAEAKTRDFEYQLAIYLKETDTLRQQKEKAILFQQEERA